MKVNFTSIVGVVNTVGLAVLAYLLIDSLDKTNERIEELTTRTIQTNNIVEQWVSKEGELITKANSNYLTLQQLLNSNDRSIDSLRKSVEGNIRRLDRVTTIWTETAATLRLGTRDTVLYIGSTPIRARSFAHNDEWLSLKGTLFQDSLSLSYQMRTRHSLEYSWSRTGFLKPKELSVLVKTDNPFVMVNRVQQFQVLEKRTFWEKPATQIGLGFAAGLVTHRLLFQK